jgi:hypothetical protein
MTAHLGTDVETWTLDTSDTDCDIPGCCQQPSIIVGGGWHQKFCTLHQRAAADLALHFPAFPGWYRIEHITTDTRGRVTARVHPL